MIGPPRRTTRSARNTWPNYLKPPCSPSTGSMNCEPLSLRSQTPTDDDLALDGRYLIETYSAPGPAGSPAVPLRVCRPASLSRPVPAPYFAHSGGRIGGTSRHGLLEALFLAEQVGAAVISVEYRLAPEAPPLGPVEDCYAGLVWVVQTPKTYNSTPTGSYSSGAAPVVA